MTFSKPVVVIVGGGFGGLQAAKSLKKSPVRIVLVDRNNYHLFQPLLYQVATAGLSPSDIAEPIRKILKDQANAEVRMAEVTGIDLAGKTLRGKEESLTYDYLVLAPGASYNYFGHDPWAKIAPELKTLQNALEIRQRILLSFERAEVESEEKKKQELLTFVVVGGGPTGVEMAGSIAELTHRALFSDFRHLDMGKVRILLAEAGPRILPSFPESLAAKARAELVKLGVEVRERSPVEEISDAGVRMAGEFIPARNVLWAAGVKASSLIQSLGGELDSQGRIKVRPDLSLRDHPEVFVIGDAAHCLQEGKPLPGLAPVALQQGRYVGRLITSRVTGRPPPPPFRYFDKGQMATVGRAFAIAEIGKLKFSGFFGWLMWIFVHIFFLIGMRNRVAVLLQWAWYYFTYERGSRLITVPPQTDELP
jgi:NADH dehydrogenase